MHSFNSIGVLDVETGEFREVYSVRGRLVSHLAYAPYADLIFHREFASGEPCVVATEVATGTARMRTCLSTQPQQILADPWGRRVWVRTLFWPGVIAFDVATGTEVARSDPMSNLGPLVLDAPRGVLLVPWTVEGRLAVLDAESLQTRAVLRVAGEHGPNLFRAFTVHHGRWMTGAYVLRAEDRLVPRTCNAIELDALDPAGNRRASIDVLAALGPGGDFCDVFGVLVRSPFAPSDLVAAVERRRVILSWQNPGDVAEFEVQAGLTPGGTVLTQRVGRSTTVAFDNVPAGTYYVRIRAFNEVGGSPVSHEVRVEVR